MSVVTIEAIQGEPEPELAGGLLGPGPGEGSTTFSFNVRGWAAVPPGAPPPGPSGEVEGAVGFEVLVRAIELAPRFSIDVVVVLGDGSVRPLATVAGSRQLLAVPRDPGIDPAMITTIGRS